MRHQARVVVFQAIYCQLLNPEIDKDYLFSFSWSEKKLSSDAEGFARLILVGIEENFVALEEIICRNLDNWELERISKIDHSVLLLGTYSIVFQKDIPTNVSINEAIEIAKEYGKPDSYKFVNGVLDNINKTEK